MPRRQASLGKEIKNRQSFGDKVSRLYVTMFPCNECAKVIIQSGVSEVVYFIEKRMNNSVAYIASHKLLSMAGVKVRKHQPWSNQILIKFEEPHTWKVFTLSSSVYILIHVLQDQDRKLETYIDAVSHFDMYGLKKIPPRVWIRNDQKCRDRTQIFFLFWQYWKMNCLFWRTVDTFSDKLLILQVE